MASTQKEAKQVAPKKNIGAVTVPQYIFEEPLRSWELQEQTTKLDCPKCSGEKTVVAKVGSQVSIVYGKPHLRVLTFLKCNTCPYEQTI